MTGAPIRILVVDDEPPIRKLLRMGLSTQGYDILEASNGKIALELLSQRPALPSAPGLRSRRWSPAPSMANRCGAPGGNGIRD